MKRKECAKKIVTKELEEQIKKHEELGKQIEEMRVQLDQIDFVRNLIWGI